MSKRLAGVAGLVVALAVVLWLAAPLWPGRSAAGEGGPKPATRTAPATWHRPRSASRSAERRAMVRRQIEGRGIRSAAVLDALRHVPRHEFVPTGIDRRAYDDSPLPIGHGQTISQPYIVAFMTEALDLKPGDRVLEVGTGSGYQAAVLAELTPNVHTIEIVRALGKQAAARLTRLGYKTVRTRVADGYFGWPDAAPFDAIIVTCAAGSVPPPIVQQLKPGGRLCIPVGPPGHVQQLVLVSKDAEGAVRSKSLMAVVFVPLTRKVR